MISLQNITKSYSLQSETIEILKGVDLQLRTGELTYLIGESGCGKSTLLHIIGGIDRPTSGNYSANGKQVFEMKDIDLASFRRDRIGFIFQSFHLLPHLTALENVEMSLILDGTSKQQRRKKAMELLELVQLQDRANHYPKQLSGGQKQRIAIARALANNPDIILADEPTGALDSQNSGQIMNILKKIAQQGKIVLVVTHSPAFNDLADRIITMKDGVIVDDQPKTSTETNTLMKEKTKKKAKPHLDFLTSLKLSMRNIRNKKWRNLLTSIGSAIGIFGILIILALSNGVKDRISSTVEDKKEAYAIYVTKEDQSLIPSSTRQDLLNIEGVEQVVHDNPFEIMLKTSDGAFTTMSSHSLGAENLASTYSPTIIHGNYPVDGNVQILIPERIAEELYGSIELAVGAKVQLTAQLMSLSKVFKTVDLEGTISGIVENNSLPILDSFYISDFASNEIMNADSETANQVFSFKVYAKNPDILDKVQEVITALGFKTHIEGNTAEVVNDYIDMAALALGLLSAISLIVSSIMIGIVLYVGVIERTREIGILKAIGATTRDIRRIFVTEGFCIALIGGMIGVIGAAIVVSLLNVIIKNAMEVSFALFQISFLHILYMLGVSAVIGIIASYFPAFKASRQDPVDALRYE